MCESVGREFSVGEDPKQYDFSFAFNNVHFAGSLLLSFKLAFFTKFV